MSLRLPTEMHSRLVRIAASEHRTFSQHVRHLLDREIELRGDTPAATHPRVERITPEAA